MALVAVVLAGLAGCRGSGGESLDPPAPAPTRLDGTLFFLAAGPEKGGIWSLTGSVLTREVRQTSEQFFQTVTVSPDGTRYAFVDAGQLRVAPIGGSPTAVGPPVLSSVVSPQWTADGSALIVGNDDGTFARLDIESGETEPVVAAPEPYAAFSVDDGTHAIYGDPAREEWRVGPVGPDASTSPVISVPFRRYTRFQSLAPDGRHAVVLLRGLTEPRAGIGRTLAANAIVDLITGTQQRIPGGGTPRQGFFRPDGGAVLRVSEGLADRVVLISPAGEVVDRADLPRGVSDLSLLAYSPGTVPAPTQTPTATPTATPPATSGTLFFLGDGAVHALHDGTLSPVASQAGAAFQRTVTVSPDGSRYAYVDEGRLHIAPLDGEPVAVGPAGLHDGYAPTWSADGDALIVRDDQDRFGYVDASSGVHTPLPEDEDFVVFSPDGAFAVTGTPDRYHVVHVDAEPSPVPVVVPEGERIVRLLSLSPDGNHGIVRLEPDGGVAAPSVRLLDATAILDLALGTTVPIPGGGTLRQGFFLPDGGVVLRVTEQEADRVLLVDRTGSVSQRIDLPPQVAELALLSYAP